MAPPTSHYSPSPFDLLLRTHSTQATRAPHIPVTAGPAAAASRWVDGAWRIGGVHQLIHKHTHTPWAYD